MYSRTAVPALQPTALSAPVRRWVWRIAQRGPTRPKPMAWWSASTDASSARCWASRLPSHRDLETLLQGFNRAYNARRQRVLKGRSPERVVHERLGAVPTRANSSHDPPFDPCSLPKALQVIARTKDVSHPDSL